MKKLVFVLAFCVSLLRGQDTFSIVALDTVTGEIGSAGASCINALSIPGGCVVISHIQPGRGAVHTQAQYLAANKTYGASLLASGKLPAEILDSLIAYDATQNPAVRQYGVVVLDNGVPHASAYTGAGCMDYKNHLVGRHYAIQGNILSGQAILDSMETRFLRTEGDLACKLMEALEGAKVPGADARCLSRNSSSLSAFLRVARPTNTLGGYRYDLNVPYGPNGFEPIDSLRTLFTQAGGCLATKHVEDDARQYSVFFNSTLQTLIIQGGPSGIGEIRLFSPLGQSMEAIEIPIPGEVSLGHLPVGVWYYQIIREGTVVFQGKTNILNR